MDPLSLVFAKIMLDSWDGFKQALNAPQPAAYYVPGQLGSQENPHVWETYCDAHSADIVCGGDMATETPNEWVSLRCGDKATLLNLQGAVLQGKYPDYRAYIRWYTEKTKDDPHACDC